MTEEPQLSTSAGPGSPGHPELEELAALADGLLSPADAKRIRSHFDACETCYEIFAETLQIHAAMCPEDEEEEDDDDETGEEEDEPQRSVIPWPTAERTTPPPARPRWIPAIAAALFLVAVGGAFWFSPFAGSTLEVATLAAPLAAGANDKSPGTPGIAWQERTMRGGGAQTARPVIEAQAVQLGVGLFNLQIALTSGDRSAADTAAAQLNGILGITGSKYPEGVAIPLDPSVRKFYGDLRARLEGTEPRSLAPEAARKAETLRTYSYFDAEKAYVTLGAWTAAGYWAATSQRPFAQRSAAHAVLGKLRDYLNSDPEADLPDKVIAALESIGRLPTNDVVNAKPAFEKILLHYYPTGRPQ